MGGCTWAAVCPSLSCSEHRARWRLQPANGDSSRAPQGIPQGQCLEAEGDLETSGKQHPETDAQSANQKEMRSLLPEQCRATHPRGLEQPLCEGRLRELHPSGPRDLHTLQHRAKQNRESSEPGSAAHAEQGQGQTQEGLLS